MNAEEGLDIARPGPEPSVDPSAGCGDEGGERGGLSRRPEDPEEVSGLDAEESLGRRVGLADPAGLVELEDRDGELFEERAVASVTELELDEGALELLVLELELDLMDAELLVGGVFSERAGVDMGFRAASERADVAKRFPAA